MYGHPWTSSSNAAATAQPPSKPGPSLFATGFGTDRPRPLIEISGASFGKAIVRLPPGQRNRQRRRASSLRPPMKRRPASRLKNAYKTRLAGKRDRLVNETAFCNLTHASKKVSDRGRTFVAGSSKHEAELDLLGDPNGPYFVRTRLWASRPRHRFTDRLRICRVVLATLDVGLHVLRRHQLNLMTERNQFTGPVV